MRARKWVRGLALALASGGVLMGAQSAYALSNTPDVTGMVNGKVFATAQLGNTLYVGGAFTAVLDANGKTAYAAQNLAAFDISTGNGIPTFTPAVTGTAPQVRSLAVSGDGSTLYVGGVFEGLDGAARSNLAAIDLSSGHVNASFHPAVTAPAGKSAMVNAILPSASKVYFGGDFTAVDGKARPHLAALSSAGVLDNAWKPKANRRVRELIFAPDGQTIFAGGRFNIMDGQTRESVARLTPDTGALDPWSIPVGSVGQPMNNFSLVARGNVLYGGFGLKPNFAAAFRLDNGTVGTRIWRFNTVGNVESVALNPAGTTLFIGGHFGTGQLQQTVCGTLQLHGLAALNPATGVEDCSWVPQLAPFGNNFIGAWRLLVDGTHLWVAGSFRTIGGDLQRSLARFTL